MPAKVIFIAATVIVAAGIVVYENREHVYEFVDRTRRKVANSLQALAEEISPQRERIALSSSGPFSSSTVYREGANGERGYEARSEGEQSFSKEGEAYGPASSSGREPFYNENNTASESFIRHRGQPGAVTENLVVFDAATESSRFPSPSVGTYGVLSRHSSSSTLYQEKPLPQTPADLPPALPPKPQSLISDSQQSPGSGVILDPFTDAAAVQEFVFEKITEQTNTPSPRANSSTGDQEEHAPNSLENSQPYWSIHEWANTTHTPTSSSPSLAGSAAEEVEQPADDILSDFGSEVESVGSWTEIGSSVSGDDN